MAQTILSLSKQLISIKSTADNPQDLQKVLKTTLSHLHEYSIERFEKNGTKSALIYNTAKRPKQFKILLNAHLDIVPGKENQYSPKIVGDKLYGVGALDMKSNAACMILAFKAFANKVKYPLALQLVTDEEVGGFNGTKYQIEKGVRADFVIAGETTNFEIVNKAKGILQLEISAHGKTGHSAYPWKGKNAIWEMNKLLNLIQQKYPILDEEKWVTTVNLSRIETNNTAINKIPDDCSIYLDIRYIPEDSNSILKDIKKLLPKGFILKVYMKEPAKSVSENNPYIKTAQKIAQPIVGKRIIARGANGSSDARHFVQIGCPGIEFGAVGGGIGSDHEWVSISSLGKYYKILERFLFAASNV